MNGGRGEGGVLIAQEKETKKKERLMRKREGRAGGKPS